MSLQTTLTWSTANAASASISGIGAVALSGSLLVDITSSPETFTITATNCIGVSVQNNVVVTVAAPTIDGTFTASPSPITPCNPSAVTLAWAVSYDNATELRITDDHGNTWYEGTDSTGTVLTYPLDTTVFTLSAVGPFGTADLTATVTFAQSGRFARPNVNGDVSMYGSLASGMYLSKYVAGSYQYDPDTADYGHTLNGTRNIHILDPIQPQVPGFYITDFNGNRSLAAGDTVLYPTAAECQSANASAIAPYYHVGGDIGIYLNDWPYFDNQADTVSPVWALCGPFNATLTGGATISLGASCTIAWTTAGPITADSISIDQGVGPVATSGSTAVSPTVTTTYTITATYGGFPVTATAVVYVVTPGAVNGLTGWGTCGGNAHFDWLESENATGYIVGYRLGEAGAFTQIATPMIPSYDGAPLTYNDAYQYRFQATDSQGNIGPSSYMTLTVSSVPSAPSLLAAMAYNSRVALAWAASVNARRYLVYRDGVYLATTATNSYSDTTAVNGTSYSYMVSAANDCGESAHTGTANATPLFKYQVWTTTPGP